MEFKTYDEWSNTYDELVIDKLPYYHDKMFTCSSFLGFKIGDKVHICSKELINEKYSNPEEFTSTELKQNIVSDIFIYTKHHKIQNIKLIFEYDSNVKKMVTGAVISFEGLAQAFTITSKEQLFKYKTEKVTKFQDDIISHLTYIAEYYKSIKKRGEGSNTTGTNHFPGRWRPTQVNNYKSTNFPPSSPAPSRIDSHRFNKIFHHESEPKPVTYLQIELFGVDIMVLFRHVFDFMTAVFSFDFSSRIDTTKITKILKKEDKVQDEDLYSKIQEHEEYGRSVDEFLSKYNKKEKIKKLFNEEE